MKIDITKQNRQAIVQLEQEFSDIVGVICRVKYFKLLDDGYKCEWIPEFETADGCNLGDLDRDALDTAGQHILDNYFFYRSDQEELSDEETTLEYRDAIPVL